jgi:hypothetical protein
VCERKRVWSEFGVREREERERERERGEGWWGIEKGNNCGWTPMMKGCGRYIWTALQSATNDQSEHNHNWAAPLKLTPTSCSICNHKLVCFELVMGTASSKLGILISKSAWWSHQLNVYEEPLHKVDLMWSMFTFNTVATSSLSSLLSCNL